MGYKKRFMLNLSIFPLHTHYFGHRLRIELLIHAVAQYKHTISVRTNVQHSMKAAHR